MAQYVDGRPGLRVLVDFVDVDSAKWSQYAPAHRWPMSWVYRREAERLLDHERAVAGRAAHSFFVTDKETALFRQLAPGASSVQAMGNGVDAAGERAVINSSRGIIYASRGADFAEAARAATQDLRVAINRVLDQRWMGGSFT